MQNEKKKNNFASSENLSSRKGARRPVDIPIDVLEGLHRGELETVNLMEWLAIDHYKVVDGPLCEALTPVFGDSIDGVISGLKAALGREKKLTAVKATRIIGHGLAFICEAAGVGILSERSVLEAMKRCSGSVNSFSCITVESAPTLELVIEILSSHQSDLLREYSAYTMAMLATSSVTEKLARVRPLAADGHFHVREIGWIAIRDEIAASLDESIEELSGWATDDDANIRRFASELTRPRGVWCRHIPELKRDPSLGLPILEPLRADESKYVQDSVANWLNDASKTDPEFVMDVCNRWRRGKNPNTLRIIRRALRSIGNATDEG